MSGKGFTMKKDWDNPIDHAMPEAVRVPAELRIGNVQVAPATVLAPMAGVTDTVFRRFIRHASLFTANSGSFSETPPSAAGSGFREGTGSREGTGFSPYINQFQSTGALAPEVGLSSISAEIDTEVSNHQSGCGLLMTEFTSADGLSRMRESKRKRYLTFYDDEHPIGAQLFGSNPETLSEAARIVQDTGFDTVDLNLGCPAKRVVGCNGGSGLLRDLPKIAQIFRQVRAAVTIPFTVKFRLGWNDSQIVCVELARIAQEEGLCAVALHARTREQGYTGQARWEWIAAVKQALQIPVIGNGDIRTPEDAAAMVAQTHCDAVMIGRAAPSNPWIFRQIAQYTATGSYTHPTEADRYRMIRTYFQMLLDEVDTGAPTDRFSSVGWDTGAPTDRFSSVGWDTGAHADRSSSAGSQTGAPGEKSPFAGKETAGKMKQFASWFTHGVPGGSKLRQQIFQSKTGPAVLQAVDDFFESRLNAPATDSQDIAESESNELFPVEAGACGD